MSKPYLLAIDAGTGSVRAVLFDTQGNQLGCEQREWDHKEDPRYPGSMDFDWSLNWQLTCECTKGLLRQTGITATEIGAVSTTCMREGIVLYDGDGMELWACANVDARSCDEVGKLIRMNPELEREIYAESGQTYALGALPRLLWVKDKLPEIYSRTAQIGMFNDWLVYKLSGVLAVEPSNGSTTGIFNLKNRAWNPEIARKCGLRDDIFPAVKECGQIISSVTAKGARDSGLAEGTPIVVGGGDAQLGCIGVGAYAPGQAAIFGGSFWQYEFNTANAHTDPQCRVRVNCHAVPGVWQYEALAFKPGLVMRWYRDAFCQWEKEKALALGEDPYALMDREAEKIPAGSNGMMCMFSDIMNFISWRHAAPTFTNFQLDAEKFNRYTFYRAIMENTSMLALGHMELVREATGNMPSEIIFAGGASKSPLWRQITADVLGLPLKTPVVKEATALGAAILAGCGVGIFKSVAEATEAMVKFDQVCEPSMENHQLYKKLFETWKPAYSAQLSLADRKLTSGLWTAPGL